MSMTKNVIISREVSLTELAEDVVNSPAKDEEIVDFVQEINGIIGEVEFSYNLIKELVSDYVAGLEDDDIDGFFEQLQKDIP